MVLRLYVPLGNHLTVDLIHLKVSTVDGDMKISENIERILRHVFITMKASHFESRYASLVKQHRMNCEIVFDLPSLVNENSKFFKHIAAILNRTAVRRKIHAPFQEIFLGAPDPLVRNAAVQRLKKAFNVAKLFSPEIIVIHLNYEDKRFGFVYNEWLQYALENIEYFAQKAQKIGAMLVLENVYEETPSAMREVLVRLSGKNVGICLDVGHVKAFSKTPLRKWIATLGFGIRHFHLHDNDGTKDAHLPIGEGTIDFSQVVRYILSASHEIRITLEPHSIPDIWKACEGFCKKGLLDALAKKDLSKILGSKHFTCANNV